jgi:hypothetical protein
VSDAKQKPSMPRAGGVPKRVVNPMAAWEERTTLVKREVEAERIATDAKTVRLRALRLAKEAADADEETANGEKAKPSPAARKRKPRII